MDARRASRRIAVTDLNIESIATGGDGVGRTEGMVVFVPRAAVGDQLDVRVSGKKSFGRGVIRRIVHPSPDRIEPPCAHYTRDRCGGCQLQHLRYEAQLSAKSTIIRDGLVRIGKRAIERPNVEASPAEWRYRSKLTLAFVRTNGAWTIGLHPFDDAATVFQLDDCPITDERVVAIWRKVFAQVSLLSPITTRGSVRLLDDGSASLVLEGDGGWTGASRLLEAVPEISAIWWKAAGSGARLMASRVENLTGASFSQVNSGMAAALHAHVIERVRASGANVVVDGYAGSGATAIPLAEAGHRVVAIELDRNAAAAIASRLPAGSRSIAGAVEEHLPSAFPADLVLLNPPRTGLAQEVPGQLESSTAQQIIYVSCNPATLGRDLARMPSYRVTSVHGFDMFPQTAHVETVCELTRIAA
jgi:23S rRNA (uracil1939-C5)-methyltransferase